MMTKKTGLDSAGKKGKKCRSRKATTKVQLPYCGKNVLFLRYLFSLNLYLFVAVSLTALVMANIVALGLNSAQGYIWDKEDESLNARSSSRRFVEPLVYMNIVLTLGELLWAFVGTAWTIRGFVTGCLEPGKLTFTDAPLIAVFVVIVLTWIGRGIVVQRSTSLIPSKIQ